VSKLPDLYAVLQVDPRADKEIIDVAYRKLAAKYHPDVNPSPKAAQHMKQINAAYQVLRDPRLSQFYDRDRGGRKGTPLNPVCGVASQRCCISQEDGVPGFPRSW
jgi:curved DNA-binding protein CbpA